MASVLISADSAPALGDVRALGAGDTIYTAGGWTRRSDAARYADAIAVAVMRGAGVEWVRGA